LGTRCLQVITDGPPDRRTANMMAAHGYPITDLRDRQVRVRDEPVENGIPRQRLDPPPCVYGPPMSALEPLLPVAKGSFAAPQSRRSGCAADLAF
jgi:hypothetical protein